MISNLAQKANGLGEAALRLTLEGWDAPPTPLHTWALHVLGRRLRQGGKECIPRRHRGHCRLQGLLP